MQGVLRSNYIKSFMLIVLTVIAVICMAGSVILGFTHINFLTIIHSFTQFNGSNQEIILRQERVPRALIGAAVGASLAMAGALMQGLTRNPLASPNILGVNAGASFFIVVAVTFFKVTSLSEFTWLAFAGAALSSIIVYVIGSAGREGLTPVKMTLAGASIAALFSSMTQGLLAINEKSLDTVLFWLVGSIQGRDIQLLVRVLPYLVIGWAGALLIGRQMNLLSLGDRVAKGLGQNTFIIKLAAGILVVFLAGGSVAIAGPVGFIGIVIPHIGRWFVGNDYRWLLPYSAVLGMILLLIADIAARYVAMPSEVPVGVMTAIVGTPFFIYLARKGDFK